jgi:hypothetical protein
VRAAAAAAAVLLLPPFAEAQHGRTGGHGQNVEETTSAEIVSFLADVAPLAERYGSRANAIRDGFRRLGPDFPAMGEHWIHPGRMVSGVLDTRFPQALSYVVLDGEPRLVGIIFAKPLAPGDLPPDFPPGADGWHDHSGSVDEESFLLELTTGSDPGAPGVRLTMLHVWLRPDDVRDRFQPENWALPFWRLGLTAPDTDVHGAAKALYLATGGTAYFRLLFGAMARPDPGDAATAEALFEETAERVRTWLRQRDPIPAVSSTELETLERIWQELWVEVRRGISPETAARIDPRLVP